MPRLQMHTTATFVRVSFEEAPEHIPSVVKEIFNVLKETTLGLRRGHHQDKQYERLSHFEPDGEIMQFPAIKLFICLRT